MFKGERDAYGVDKAEKPGTTVQDHVSTFPSSTHLVMMSSPFLWRPVNLFEAKT